MHVRRIAIVTGLVIAAACSNAPEVKPRADARDGSTARVDQPGVTDEEIRVGAVASITNPLGERYGDFFDGIRSYFDMVNEEGGVHGRHLRLVSERDDETVKNRAEVQALLQRDDVFAVMVASLLFTGADLLADSGVPTFGWHVNPEWNGPPNLFGEKGFVCFGCRVPFVAWLARETGAERIGIVGYNVAQSIECAEGDKKSFEEFGGAEVVFVDTSVPFGIADWSGDVAEMKRHDVELILTCIDQNGAASLAREMRKQGLDATLYLPNAYNHEFVEKFADALEGSYVLFQATPFEIEHRPEGLERFLDRINAAGTTPSESALAGWLAADMLVTGLREAGEHFTRARVVDALNQLTDYDADGILAGIDWTVSHKGESSELCYAVLQIVDGHLEPRFGKPDKPFVCFDRDADVLPDAPVRRG